MRTEIRTIEAFRRPSGFLPIAMSACALAVIVLHLARFGSAPQADEGTAAHLWQLLMAGQLPIVGFFILRHAPQSPREMLTVLAAQIGAAVAALLPVYLLHW